MASISSNLRLGNTTPSSLIKSANSIALTEQAIQDKAQAEIWDNSGYTDEAYDTYSTYLNNRINSLNATNTPANVLKAMDLTDTLRAATHSNISASIQQENIQILAGNATKEDKYNLISNQFVRAINNGDMTLASQLESQAYSLKQSILYDAQSAASAASASATAKASSEEDVATNLTDSLKQLNQDIKTGGAKALNSTVAAWVKANQATLEANGVKLPSGAQPNYWSLVEAVGGAIYNAHMIASAAVSTTNPAASQKYYDAGVALQKGISKLPTLAGNKTIQGIQQAMADPYQYVYDTSTGELHQTTQTGYKLITQRDSNGNPVGKAPVATFSGSLLQTTFLSPAQVVEMNSLGLKFKGSNTTSTNSVGTGVQVQATQNTPQWLRNILGDNGVTEMYTQNNGNTLQFLGDSTETTGGKAIFSVATDSKGLKGVFETLPDGSQKPLGGNYGFNQKLNTVTNPKGMNELKTAGAPGTTPDKMAGVYASLGFGKSNPGELINAAEQTERQINEQNAIAAKAMLAYTPPKLPQISIAPPPSAQQTQTTKAAATVSVQQPKVNPQTPVGSSTSLGVPNFNLQGAGSITL